MKSLIYVLLAILLSSCSPQEAARPDSQKVADNQIVIVKEEDSIGVFRLFDQIQEPETARYKWSLFEVDSGNNSLNKIESGEGFAGHDPIGFFSFYNDIPIEFGSFKYSWSINTKGRGWVYFLTQYGHNKQSYCISKNSEKYAIEELVRGCDFKVMPGWN